MTNPTNEQGAASPSRPRLLDQVRNAIRRKHYSLRTEESYVHWIKRFIYFHGKRHPKDLGYTLVRNKGGRGVKSPLDRLEQPRAGYAV